MAWWHPPWPLTLAHSHRTTFRAGQGVCSQTEKCLLSPARTDYSDTPYMLGRENAAQPNLTDKPLLKYVRGESLILLVIWQMHIHVFEQVCYKEGIFVIFSVITSLKEERYLSQMVTSYGSCGSHTLTLPAKVPPGCLNTSMAITGKWLKHMFIVIKKSNKPGCWNS